jgi:hypothetical protein
MQTCLTARLHYLYLPNPPHTPHTSSNFLPALFEFLVLSPQFRDDLAKFIELLTQVAVGLDPVTLSKHLEPLRVRFKFPSPF